MSHSSNWYKDEHGIFEKIQKEFSIPNDPTLLQNKDIWLRQFKFWLQDELSPSKKRLLLLGTTSSGKSTLMNALIGSNILPSDINEMSIGITRIIPKDSINSYQVHIHHPSGLFDLSFAQASSVQQRLSSIMYNHLSSIHSNRRTHLPIPHFTIYCSSRTLNLFCGSPIPELEFLDLPGLRTFTDTNNIKNLQSYTHGSYPLILLDITNLYATEEIQILIQQLVEQVSPSQNLLILLNKIDSIKTADGDLQTRINKIHQKLLTYIPEQDWKRLTLLPISSLGLLNSVLLQNYLQDHFFEENLQDFPLQNLLEHKGLLKQSLTPSEFKTIKDIFRMIEDNKTISYSQARKIAITLFQAAGGLSFGRELKKYLATEIENKQSHTPKHYTLEEARFRFWSVSSVLSHLIVADDRLDSRELTLFKSLIEEYCHQFLGFSINDIIEYSSVEELISLSHSKPLDCTKLPRNIPEQQWVLEALEMLMACDWNIHERELEIINQITELFIQIRE